MSPGEVVSKWMVTGQVRGGEGEGKEEGGRRDRGKEGGGREGARGWRRSDTRPCPGGHSSYTGTYFL